ncbi:uncharacterized protein LOC143280955 [Babylonia areolata]|uniref:uncharacterized protein LOC143280955 n=1 Tax=Babylonia areolata TaxID=304850 RepID=UPI003FD251A4
MSRIQWTPRDIMYVTAECLTGAFSVFGNSLVLVAIMKICSLRTVTNCFIGSLAAADVLVGLIIPPTVILSYMGLPRNFYGCVFVNSLVVLLTNISILSLLGVAVERFVAVKNPFLYQRVMTKKRALLVVTLTWIIAIFFGLIPLMGWHLGSEGFEFCAFSVVIDLRYLVYLNFFGMTVPLLLVMLVIYIYIFYIIRKQWQQTRYQMQLFKRNLRQHKREVRGAKGLAYVIILFTVCWFPVHIMNCITVFAPQNSAPFDWLLVAIVLSHANSFVNPFLYAFSNSKFKYAIKRILCCERSSPTDTESTFHTTQIINSGNSTRSTQRNSSWESQSLDFTQTSSVGLTEFSTMSATEFSTMSAQMNLSHLVPSVVVTESATLTCSVETPQLSEDSASKPSSSEQKIYNGKEIHTEETLPGHGQFKQCDKICIEDSPVQTSSSTYTSLALLFDDSLKIPGRMLSSYHVWVTPTSQHIEIKQQSKNDSTAHSAEEHLSKGEQSTAGDNALTEVDKEQSVDLEACTSSKGEQSTAGDNALTEVDKKQSVDPEACTSSKGEQSTAGDNALTEVDKEQSVDPEACTSSNEHFFPLVNEQKKHGISSCHEIKGTEQLHKLDFFF